MVFRGFQREDQSSPIDNIFETIALWLPRTANKDRGRGKLIRILQSKYGEWWYMADLPTIKLKIIQALMTPTLVEVKH